MNARRYCERSTRIGSRRSVRGRRVETELAAATDTAAAAALSSATAALHLALVLLDVGDGDEVWSPTLTFAATANAISYVGARPVFIDCDPDTWNLDPNLLHEALQDGDRKGVLPRP